MRKVIRTLDWCQFRVSVVDSGFFFFLSGRGYEPTFTLARLKLRFLCFFLIRRRVFGSAGTDETVWGGSEYGRSGCRSVGC